MQARVSIPLIDLAFLSLGAVVAILSQSHLVRSLPVEVTRVGRGIAVISREEVTVITITTDGLYADAGYPAGRRPAIYRGRDNLDFWSRDPAYSARHAGNQGDATDPFDGVRTRRLDFDTNPSTLRDSLERYAHTGLLKYLKRQIIGINREMFRICKDIKCAFRLNGQTKSKRPQPVDHVTTPFIIDCPHACHIFCRMFKGR